MKKQTRISQGLCLALLLAGSVALQPVSAAAGSSPQNPTQGPAQPGKMPLPQPLKSDPMAEYYKAGKVNTHVRQPPVAQAAIQAAPAARHATHLHCVFRIKPDGSYKLERAVEVDGDPLITDESAGPFISEVTNGTEVIAVQGMPDPFELRAFPRPGGNGQSGHHFESVGEAEVVVKIPGVGLADADLDKLAVHLYKWQGTEALEKVDKGSLREYKFKNRVRGFSDIPAHFLGEEIRKRGMRVPN